MKLHSDLREFIELLTSQRVEYLVVGGHAVAFHGYPRYTGDMDFWIRPTQENALRVLAVIEKFGLPVSKDLARALLEQERVFQIGRPPNRIDILTSASGIDFDTAWQNSVAGTLDEIPVRFIDIRSLIANKRAAGRAKDLADVAELEKVSKKE